MILRAPGPPITAASSPNCELASEGCTSLTACAQDSAFTPAQTERYSRLTQELISPCCWREPIAIHRFEQALQMLEEVRSLVAEGKSEEDIKAMYVQRYGVRILADPPGALVGRLYTIPLSLFCCLLFLAGRRLRWLVAQASSPSPRLLPEVLARIRAETEE